MGSNEHAWDDSDLISTWDAAHAEYMKYHSIAAQEVAAKTAEADGIQSLSHKRSRLADGEEDTQTSQKLEEHDFTSNDIDDARELAKSSEYWKGFCDGFDLAQAKANVTSNGIVNDDPATVKPASSDADDGKVKNSAEA